MMIALNNVDLRLDAESSHYVKNEVVDVVFAKADGQLMSREGPNYYAAGDALVAGSTGDRWSVSRDRFDTKYEPLPPIVHGEDGTYRNKPIPVLAKQMHQAFSIARSAGGDILRGNADDWLMQYAPDDFGIVENSRFQRVYKMVEG